MNREKIKELINELWFTCPITDSGEICHKLVVLDEVLEIIEQEGDGWIQMNKGKLINGKKYIFYKLFEDYPGEERSIIAYWDEDENCANTLPNNQDGSKYAVTHYMPLPSSPKERLSTVYKPLTEDEL